MTPSSANPGKLFTIGFAGKTAEELFALRKDAHVPEIIDPAIWSSLVALLYSEPGPERCHPLPKPDWLEEF